MQLLPPLSGLTKQYQETYPDNHFCLEIYHQAKLATLNKQSPKGTSHLCSPLIIEVHNSHAANPQKIYSLILPCAVRKKGSIHFGNVIRQVFKFYVFFTFLHPIWEL